MMTINLGVVCVCVCCSEAIVVAGRLTTAEEGDSSSMTLQTNMGVKFPFRAAISARKF